MTEDVADLGLPTTTGRTCCCPTARPARGALLPVHQRLMTVLEQRGLLDREIEYLPTDEQIAARIEQGKGLSSRSCASCWRGRRSR